MRLKYKAGLLFSVLFCFLFCSQGFSLPYEITFMRYTMDNGLSNNSVHCVLEDKDGFMWFGTEEGLNRFDGYFFKTINADKNEILHLSDKRIRCLMQDHTGIIWIGTAEGGINRFEPDEYKIKYYVHNPQDSLSLSSNFVISLFEDSQGRIWAGTERGLNLYDPENDCFRRVGDESTKPLKQSVHKIVENIDGTFWLGISNSLCLFDPVKMTTKRVLYDKVHNNSLTGSVQEIYKDENGILWLGTGNSGFVKFDPKTNKYWFFKNDPSEKNSISNNRITSILPDDDHNFWIGTRDGLNYFNSKTEQFEHYSANVYDDRLYIDYRIVSIMKDSNDGIWFCTGNGINYLNKSLSEFKVYLKELNEPNSLSDSRVFSFFKDTDGILWVGTSNGGLNRIDRKKNKFSFFMHDPNNEKSISGNNVRSIVKDKNGYLWLAHNGTGIDRFNPKTNKFFNYKDIDDSSGIRLEYVKAIYKDSTDQLWFGTGTSLEKYNPDTDSFIHYLTEYHGNTIFGIISDSDGQLLIVYYSVGIIKFNPETGSHVIFLSKTDEPNTLPTNNVLSILRDRNNDLWIGTHHEGVSYYNHETKICSTFTTRDGLSGNSVFGILEDDEGFLWFSTDNGISRFDPIHKRFRKFKKYRSFQGNEYNVGACFKAYDGEMFFGGTFGFTSFYPHNISNEIKIPRVVINQFKVLNQIVEEGELINERILLTKPIYKTKSIQLSYKEKAFTIFFAVLDYAIPNENNFTYYLEGFDKEWHDVGNRNFATYTNVPPGHYTFKVKGANSKGEWNETGVELKISISPPFWETWLFRIFLIVTIINIFIIVLRYRVKTITLRNTQLQEMNEELNKQIFERKQAQQALKQINVELESTVAERTKELKDINRQLVQEISERKQTFYALQASEDKYRTLAETTSDIIFVYDQNNRLTYINKAGSVLCCQKNKKLNEIDFSDFIHDKYKKRVLNRLDRVRKGEKTIDIFQTEFFDEKYLGIPVEVNAASLPGKDGTIDGVLIIARNVQDRKKAEERIKTSLKEKEILLKEVHHRVKNNLQIISSLLYLQSKHISDPKDFYIFLESQNRIKSMALIHEKLYQSQNFAKIDFTAYVKKPFKRVGNSFKTDLNRIKINTHIDNIFLSIDKAIPCGLVINELVSNALKYAFPNEKGGELNISFIKEKKKYFLTVNDNGIGMPENFSVDKSKSLGLSL